MGENNPSVSVEIIGNLLQKRKVAHPKPLENCKPNMRQQTTCRWGNWQKFKSAGLQAP